MNTSKIKSLYLSSKDKQHGFTLIEILVSISILTIGILGLILVADSIIYYQSKSAEVTQATLFTTNKVEEIKCKLFFTFSLKLDTYFNSTVLE